MSVVRLTKNGLARFASIEPKPDLNPRHHSSPPLFSSFHHSQLSTSRRRSDSHLKGLQKSPYTYDMSDRSKKRRSERSPYCDQANNFELPYRYLPQPS